MPFADPPRCAAWRHLGPRRVSWLFAYGSLLPAGEARPCHLAGWQRSWGVAMDNAVDLPGYKHFVTPAGERPALMVAFLSIAPQAGATVNGVALPVADDELPGLDERERNYARVDVTDDIDAGLDGRERNYARVDVTDDIDAGLDGRVWAYAGLDTARERLALGLREGRAAIASSYHARVLEGFDGLGQRERFERLTAPMPAPIVDLEVVLHAPRAEPR